MPYTDDQIGALDIRPFSTRTKDRIVLVLVQHGSAPGLDEITQTIIAPCSWSSGRMRTITMLAAGVDYNDIRFVRVPDEYAGPGGKAGIGRPMEPIHRILWWTAGDDYRAEVAGLTTREYAARLFEQRGPLPQHETGEPVDH